jgi:hypothetical protein
MFTAWQIAAPGAGDMFPRCGICGGAADREGRDGVSPTTGAAVLWPSQAAHQPHRNHVVDHAVD